MDAVKPCVIIAGGDVCGNISVPENALLICADSGYKHAVSQGLCPDILIGDFDSWTGELPANCEVIRHPAEKDETDTLLAVYCGRDRGCTEFTIYGVFGGARPDHSLANIQLLYHMAQKGLQARLIHGNTTVTVQLPGTVYYPKFAGYFSLFSLSEECILSIRGVYYPLAEARLQNSFPLGISNRITADHAEVTLRSGALLVMQAQDGEN